MVAIDARPFFCSVEFRVRIARLVRIDQRDVLTAAGICIAVDGVRRGAPRIIRVEVAINAASAAAAAIQGDELLRVTAPSTISLASCQANGDDDDAARIP
jgi:hypothetical protein